MTDKAANSGIALIASIGMALTALGIIGVDLSQPSQHPRLIKETSIECKQ